MRQQQMTRLIHSLPQLTHHQRQQLARSLQALLDHSQAIAVVEAHSGACRACPHCSSSLLVKNGSANGLQRFKCRHCARTFNALTGTPLARLHLRDKWMGQAQALGEGLSLNQVAQRLGVAQSTAFRWRHRFLRDAAGHRAEHEAGIVEADETFFLESFKGQRHLPRPARHRGGVAGKRGLSAEQIPVLVVRDRSGQTADFKLEKLDAAHVIAALRPLVDQEAILCSDSAGVYAAFARATGIAHRPLNIQHGPRVLDGVFHIQNVNAYHSRLKTWVRKFNGVATRYLANYLGWFRTMDRESALGLKPAQWLALAMGNHA